MLNLEDLAATQLIANGSRVTYRLLVAGERPAVQTYSDSVQKGLQRGQRVETLDGRPEMQRTLDRAERFLALVSLLAAMIAAVAVAAAARRFSLRHLDSCAMMRCLGLAQADIFRLFALEFLVIGLIACVAGMALGYATHYALLNALGSLIKTTLPQPSLLPAVQGFACGLVLLLGLRTAAARAAAPRTAAACSAQRCWSADGAGCARLSRRTCRFLRTAALVVKRSEDRARDRGRICGRAGGVFAGRLGGAEAARTAARFHRPSSAFRGGLRLPPCNGDRSPR